MKISEEDYIEIRDDMTKVREMLDNISRKLADKAPITKISVESIDNSVGKTLSMFFKEVES